MRSGSKRERINARLNGLIITLHTSKRGVLCQRRRSECSHTFGCPSLLNAWPVRGRQHAATQIDYRRLDLHIAGLEVRLSKAAAAIT